MRTQYIETGILTENLRREGVGKQMASDTLGRMEVQSAMKFGGKIIEINVPFTRMEDYIDKFHSPMTSTKMELEFDKISLVLDDLKERIAKLENRNY